MRAPASLVGAELLEIRSFRVVFQFERRLFKIDRWRLPLPYGVPLRGIAYAAAALMAILVAGALPGVCAVIAAVPAPVKFVAAPIGVATLLARVKVDGRPAHRFAVAWARHRLGPRTLDAFAPVPASGSLHAFEDAIVLADDGTADHYRRAVINGPATVTLARTASAYQRGRSLHVTPAAGGPLRRGKQITLGAGQRVVIEAEPAR